MENISIKLVKYDFEDGFISVFIDNTEIISIYNSGKLKVWRVPTSGTILYEDRWYSRNFTGEVKFKLFHNYNLIRLAIIDRVYSSSLETIFYFYPNGTFKYQGGINDEHSEQHPKYTGVWK